MLKTTHENAVRLAMSVVIGLFAKYSVWKLGRPMMNLTVQQEVLL